MRFPFSCLILAEGDYGNPSNWRRSPSGTCSQSRSRGKRPDRTSGQVGRVTDLPHWEGPHHDSTRKFINKAPLQRTGETVLQASSLMVILVE